MTPHVDVDGAPAGPAPYEGVFAQPGALVRTPGGNVENVRWYHDAGLRWLLLNLEHDEYDWATVIGRCRAVGMPWGWWFHCRTHEQLDMLADATLHAQRPIVGYNVEKELETTLPPRTVELYRTAEAALITYGWVPNSVDLAPVARWPVMLEMFPADAPALYDADTQTVKWKDCEAHARHLGARHPQCLMQAYRGAQGWGQPTWYTTAPQPRHVYTLDDATGENGPIGRWTA